MSGAKPVAVFRVEDCNTGETGNASNNEDLTDFYIDRRWANARLAPLMEALDRWEQDDSLPFRNGVLTAYKSLRPPDDWHGHADALDGFVPGRLK